MTAGTPSVDALVRTRRRALGLGLVASVLAALGLLVDADRFWRAWLVAVVLATGVASGCLALSLLHALTGGAWGQAVRRPLEAAAATLPVLGVLFVPLLVGLPRLYPWARPDEVAADPLLQHKAAWLNVPGFTGRFALVFLVWIASALVHARLVRRDERRGRPAPGHATRRVAAPALLAWVLATTVAAIDWIMSLEPHWTSSLFGLAFVSGSALSALAFVVLATVAAPGAAGEDPAARLHDLGTLLFAFVMLFAYLAFSQFLLIWSADVPEEVTFYLDRSRGGWGWVAGALALLHFAVPFGILLGRGVKRDPRWLGAIAAGLLVMRWVDLQWHVAPTAPAGGLLHWIDVAALVGVASLFVATFTWQLLRREAPSPTGARDG